MTYSSFERVIFVPNMGLHGIIAVILGLLNAMSFLSFGIDKWKARHGRWRIPEATLLLLAFLGGAPGALLGMKTFHHKTKPRKFTILVPLFLVLQIALAAWLLWRSRGC